MSANSPPPKLAIAVLHRQSAAKAVRYTPPCRLGHRGVVGAPRADRATLRRCGMADQAIEISGQHAWLRLYRLRADSRGGKGAGAGARSIRVTDFGGKNALSRAMFEAGRHGLRSVPAENRVELREIRCARVNFASTAVSPWHRVGRRRRPHSDLRRTREPPRHGRCGAKASAVRRAREAHRAGYRVIESEISRARAKVSAFQRRAPVCERYIETPGAYRSAGDGDGTANVVPRVRTRGSVATAASRENRRGGEETPSIALTPKLRQPDL